MSVPTDFLSWLMVAVGFCFYLGYGFWMTKVLHSKWDLPVLFGWPLLALVTGFVGFFTMVKEVLNDTQGP